MAHHDLVVVGAGSGNFVIDDSFADLDVAIISEGPFGGTCLNAGCIPSKMFVHSAAVADTVRDAARFDVDAELRGVRWQEMRDRIFGRLDPHAVESKRGREESDFVSVYSGHAEFTGPKRLRVQTADGPVTVEGDQVVVAAGSRPVVPPVVADSGVPYQTSDTIMRIAEPPQRLAVLGGGYIATELAQVFAATGSTVTIIERTPFLLSGQDVSICQAYTEIAERRFDLRLKRELVKVTGDAGEVHLTLDDGSTIDADMLLIAVGRRPNGDHLRVDLAGIDTHDDGRIVVDRHQRTSAPGVFALGDVCTAVPLKHVANREAKVVAHNLRHADGLTSADDDPVPAAIFTRPQIAAVGATEQDLRDQGRDYVVGIERFADVAYGWAMEDDTGFCKILADPATGRLLGAHLLGPHAATLIHVLVVAMTFGIDARALAAKPYWIHPAPAEVIENALLALDL